MYPDGQPRTLERRLKEWRRAAAQRMVFGTMTADPGSWRGQPAQKWRERSCQKGASVRPDDQRSNGSILVEATLAISGTFSNMVSYPDSRATRDGAALRLRLQKQRRLEGEFGCRGLGIREPQSPVRSQSQSTAALTRLQGNAQTEINRIPINTLTGASPTRSSDKVSRVFLRIRGQRKAA